MTDFLRVEHRPFFIVKLHIKILKAFKINKIDKSVSYVTQELYINRQIKKIVFALELSVNEIYYKIFSVFVRYILDHNRCLISQLNSIFDNLVLLFILNWHADFVWLFRIRALNILNALYSLFFDESRWLLHFDLLNF